MAINTNKAIRRRLYVTKKQTDQRTKREIRFRRRREEEKNPQLLEERRSRNIPVTVDQKRVWDVHAEGDLDGDCLGRAINIHLPAEAEKTVGAEPSDETTAQDDPHQVKDELYQKDDDDDSMLNDDGSVSSDESSGDTTYQAQGTKITSESRQEENANLSHPSAPITSGSPPAALLSKFPSLFHGCEEPRILVTTSIGNNLHKEARLLTRLFPNSTYIKRTGHRYSYQFSLREISSFASNRGYTALIVLREDQKHPRGLDIVHLPSGPSKKLLLMSLRLSLNIQRSTLVLAIG
ncbi:MAG: hypothetical protein Q9163_005349 [Psora crenata]